MRSILASWKLDKTSKISLEEDGEGNLWLNDGSGLCQVKSENVQNVIAHVSYRYKRIFKGLDLECKPNKYRRTQSIGVAKALTA